MRVAVIAMAATLTCLAGARAEQMSVPFVGCPADGQAGPIAPPEGLPKVVTLRGVQAERVAYYKGAQSFGVFAPRGWHCRVLYGSSGSSIVVSPTSLDPSEFPPSKIHDQAIELVYLDGGTSGRFPVAIYASRLFPKLAVEFVARVKSEGIKTASEFERGPYTNESVTYPAKGVAKFVTPANGMGLGTEGMLAPTQDAVHGIAALQMSGDWGISVLRVRLRPGMHDLETVIMRLNQSCVGSANGC